MPKYHYRHDYEVLVTHGKLAYDAHNDLLLYYPESEGEHVIIVRRAQ
jgi:hypothetical protein